MKKRVYKPILKVCENCGRDFIAYKNVTRFCSSNCSNKFHRKNRDKEHSETSQDENKSKGLFDYAEIAERKEDGNVNEFVVCPRHNIGDIVFLFEEGVLKPVLVLNVIAVLSLVGIEYYYTTRSVLGEVGDEVSEKILFKNREEFFDEQFKKLEDDKNSRALSEEALSKMVDKLKNSDLYNHFKKRLSSTEKENGNDEGDN